MAPSDELASYISQVITLNETSFNLKVARSSDLTESEKDTIWDTLSANMCDLYRTSSLGWNPPSKKRELFHRLARFILVRQGEDDVSDPIAAFATFRFEREDECNVIYCYEIQITGMFRRCGLGKQLMQYVWDIGKCRKLEKVMLTVLKTNEPAVKFYKHIGFSIDPTSPGYSSPSGEWEDEEEECDYEIMSRTILS